MIKTYVFRTATEKLIDVVPQLGSYAVLKQHFEWLIDGQVYHLVEKNLGNEIQNMELFLR